MAIAPSTRSVQSAIRSEIGRRVEELIDETKRTQWGELRQYQETGYRKQQSLLRVAYLDWREGKAHAFDNLMGTIYGDQPGMTEEQAKTLRRNLGQALFARYQCDTIWADADPETDSGLTGEDKPRWRQLFDDDGNPSGQEDRLVTHGNAYTATGVDIEYEKPAEYQVIIERGKIATAMRRGRR